MATSTRPGRAPRVDYHVHTSHSFDSASSPDEIIGRAVTAGIDWLCITDHDTIDGALEMQRLAGDDMRVVVGCEFSTDDGSQVIGLGLSRMIVERRLMPLLARIREQGALVLLPHPMRRGSGVFRREMARDEGFVRDVLGACDLVERHNGRDTYETNQANVSFAIEHVLPSVVGSDAHTVAEVGSVFVEYDEVDFVHGRSARRLYYPDSRPSREHPVKRRLMETYHRHSADLPPFVREAYATSRRLLKRGQMPRSPSPPVLQHALPAIPGSPGTDV